ncbi:hypothetical protein KFZ67_01570 [Photobacterium damselae]|uniref:hypothetical protein n=1 Tax=Photobacterium damselae TaxID=38293 RepID=UPI0025434298
MVVKTRHYIWVRRSVTVALVLLVIAIMMMYWAKIERSAHEAHLHMLVGQFQENAAQLKQYWELNNRPQQTIIDGYLVQFTERGWPKLSSNSDSGCQEMWQLLAGKKANLKYLALKRNEIHNRLKYDTCYYLVSPNKWLGLGYSNEILYVGSFSTTE